MAGSRRGSAQHRTTPAQGEETRARLIDVAAELFAAHGHAAVSMEQVCARADVTRGALYHHFAGKDDLFRAVCEQVAAAVTGQVVLAARDTPDAWSRLRSGCRAFLDACTEQGVRRILLTDAPSVLGWASFRELDARHGLGLLRAGIQAAMDQGSIEPGPVDALAHLLVAALDEAAMLIGRAASPEVARRDATLVLDRILEGIAGSAADLGVRVTQHFGPVSVVTGMNDSMLTMARERRDEIMRDAGRGKLAAQAGRASRRGPQAARAARKPAIRPARWLTMAAARVRPTVGKVNGTP